MRHHGCGADTRKLRPERFKIVGRAWGVLPGGPDVSRAAGGSRQAREERRQRRRRDGEGSMNCKGATRRAFAARKRF